MPVSLSRVGSVPAVGSHPLFRAEKDELWLDLCQNDTIRVWTNYDYVLRLTVRDIVHDVFGQLGVVVERGVIVPTAVPFLDYVVVTIPQWRDAVDQAHEFLRHRPCATKLWPWEGDEDGG